MNLTPEPQGAADERSRGSLLSDSNWEVVGARRFACPELAERNSGLP
jgi:hypothetical protein